MKTYRQFKFCCNINGFVGVRAEDICRDMFARKDTAGKRSHENWFASSFFDDKCERLEILGKVGSIHDFFCGIDCSTETL